MCALIIEGEQIKTYLKEQIDNACSFYKINVFSEFVHYYVSLYILLFKYRVVTLVTNQARF